VSGFGARFLSHPDLFPARLAGEPLGDRAVTLDVAGGPYRLFGLDAGRAAAAERAFAGFLLDGATAEPGVAVRFFRGRPEEFRQIDTRGWLYALDFAHTPGQVRVAGLGFMATLAWNPALGAACWTAENGPEFAGVCENVLRIAVAYRLLEMGGVLLHSVGLADRGEASVFFGRSGAGKTTLAGLAAGHGIAVLSDDLNALVPATGDQPPRVVALPFAGDFRSAGLRRGAYPLCRLGRLVKAERDALAALADAEALSGLVAASPFVNEDPHRLGRLLENLRALLQSLSVCRLEFSRHGEPWNAWRGAAVPPQ
jgi:hypothetical protein